MKSITIKDLYAGKPDAKDEINFEGLDNFIKTFVVADHFNLDSLIRGNNCFVTGFKGTGKTALLFYLDEKIKQEDSSACSSFVFFKEDFTDAKRDELQSLAHRILSSITVESGALTSAPEFEYIWRWLIFKMIVRDNEEYSRNLFEDDETWKKFEKLVSEIRAPQNKKKMLIPNKIKLAMPCKELSSMTEVSPEVEIDLQKQSSQAYQNFVELVDEAENEFVQLKKTDIPYYIFIDELEAYYGDAEIFNRDLRMIRDLIFTVKRFNTIFKRSEMRATKIICSVRSEILTAISRFVVTKEMNKVISGFSVPLNWNYTNSNSYAHPIIQILLKRIAVCSESEGESDLVLYKRWFPEQIHGIEPANYILNNSWCKPRDMVRLISSAQNGLLNKSTSFTQAVIDTTIKTYSEESLQEIKEELRALYTSEEIDCIVSCFTGYRTSFSVKDLKARVQEYFPGSVLETNFVQVLNDLYRLGFIGNFLPAGKLYHWQHKGDPSLIMTDDWRICIHYALHSALSIGSRYDFSLTRGKEPQEGDAVSAVVTNVIKSFALVSFKLYGEEYKGRIHISEFGKSGYGFIRYLRSIIHVGDQLDTSIVKWNEKYSCWELKLIPNSK